jgi:hypothetical protein
VVKGQVRALHLDPESRQAPELDALASMLPMDRRARLVAEGLQAKGLLRRDGPHAPNTVKRRLASWRTLHRWKGIEAPLERDRGTVRSAESALGAALGRSRLAAAAPAQEQEGRDPGRLGSVDRDLRDESSSRYPGSRDPALGVRVRRAPAQLSGAATRRAAE